MRTAMQRGSLDNTSVIVVQLAEMQAAGASPVTDTRPDHLKARFRKAGGAV